MTTTTYPLHAMVQTDTGAVYGIGDDLARARQDARRAGADLDSLSSARISEAAAAHVREHGGQPSPLLAFGRVPGTHVIAVCLRSEEE